MLPAVRTVVFAALLPSMAWSRAGDALGRGSHRSAAVSTVVGIVTNAATKQPVAGATAIVIAGSDSAMSDDAGRFVLRGVARGIVSLAVRRPGYSEFVLRDFQIDSDTLHFSLELHTDPATLVVKSSGRGGGGGGLGLPLLLTLVRHAVDSVSVRVGADSLVIRREMDLESVEVIRGQNARAWYGPGAVGGLIRILLKNAKAYPYTDLPSRR